jgi:hypothetical protein
MKPQYTTEDYIFEVNKNGGLIDFSALYHRIIIPDYVKGAKLYYFSFHPHSFPSKSHPM